MDSKQQVSSRLLAIKLLLIAGTASGCGVATHSGEALSLTGSPEGIRALSDLLAGTATNAKASPDVDTPYYQLRREQNRAQAMRYTSFGKEGK